MIGIYVHNRGRGHLHRVLPVMGALRERGLDVTVLIAGQFDDALLPPGARVVHLPSATDDEEAAGELTISARRAAVAWMDQARPRAFWVDSSPAMSLAARMTGIPMVSTLPPGVREDEPHLLRVRAAERLIGAWPPGAHQATLRRTEGPVAEIGGVSRFERRDREPRDRRRRPLVVHLNGSGTGGDHRFWRAVRGTARDLGGIEWLELGGPDGAWHEDPWPELCSADVVVTGAGQASVADAACADVPLVVVPGRRPYGEQDATAEALDGIPGASVMRYGNGPTAVARAVTEQVDRVRNGEAAGIRSWWGVDGAASRAAEVIRAATTGFVR
ncbi:UDP-N-acetylglucosamine--N-acetylmuramyl-(pentapeptide) pyrophosphoryl-undecaprenol N-acetylglucosamine transferase [Dietzia sp. 2505]|uniref:glycosyltransferase n=1 Tax=Dietzia sp. 2505 TaxID=3156457 RepID=UPI00339833FF